MKNFIQYCLNLFLAAILISVTISSHGQTLNTTGVGAINITGTGVTEQVDVNSPANDSEIVEDAHVHDIFPDKLDQMADYKYESVANDPTATRIYTLQNGLKVYLSVNKDEPRIQTYIAVKTGSRNDPAEVTGLAHYLEHMMFKGTSKLGSNNWEKEKALLDQISDLYELNRMTSDPEKKKTIYSEIDKLSYEASGFAIANEYDKMVSSLGAKGTNAYTWVDQTVYTNDIPSNELERWLALESERFSELVLRLFHTELEAVYEEFNMGQDNDSRKAFQAMFESLFPTHPYGTQTTIGEGEHLKNPSMVKIHEYWDQYYVPNNIAVCISGDIDYDKTIALIDKYFGGFKAKDVVQKTFPALSVISAPIVKEVWGPQAEWVSIGYRFSGANSKDEMMAKLVNSMLYNGQAGLMDLNLNQQQKVLSADAGITAMHDYSVHELYGEPREGQSLEEVKDLLIEQLEIIKRGEFDDDLILACITDMRLQQMRTFESNNGRASAFVDAYINDIAWGEYVNEIDELSAVTKDQLIAFVKKNYANNYVVVYKRTGDAKDVFKIEKPQITPVQVIRDVKSTFMQWFEAIPSQRIQPVFVDYTKDIQTTKLNRNIDLNYIANKTNGLFELNYIFDMGTDNSRDLGVAIELLPYLGTSKYSAAALQKEFFKLGLSFSVNSGTDRVYVSLSGLEENVEKGMPLFEHILSDVQADDQALSDLIDGILKSRSDAKLNKNSIFWSGMVNYAKYGASSSFKNVLSEKDLQHLKADDLVKWIHELTGYNHRVFYYGQKSFKEAAAMVNQYHKVPSTTKAIPAAKIFAEQNSGDNIVYFVDYDMVQVQLLMLAKDKQYDKSLAPSASLFNEYFGSGLSSIVFQELREKQALAYSAYANYSTPAKKEESFFVYGFIGTQNDKLPDAVRELGLLMNNMPQADEMFSSAKDAAMKKIETSRIVKAAIYWNYEQAKRRGLDSDIRKDIYDNVGKMSFSDLDNFFQQHVAGKKYVYLVMGDKDLVDMDLLKTLGSVRELTLEELFGY